ncbi:NAD(P)-binding protein [Hypoxylon sp. FL1284]|nr:NAD(P)-binding protein [Hypoxylon sp. FL1284]
MVKVLILGATGKQGGAAARALLSTGHSVCAYVRDPSSAKATALARAGAELVSGGAWEVDTAPADLDRALAGGDVEALFFPSMPSFADAGAEVRGATNIVAAARRAPSVRHVVYSTVRGVPGARALPAWDSSPFMKNYWVSKEKGEELVRTAGFARYTILRPVEFMSNYATAASAALQMPETLRTGVLRSPRGADAPVSVVHEDDIGRAVAAVVAAGTDASPSREIDVAGETLPLGDLMAQLGAAAGKRLVVEKYDAAEAAERARGNPVTAGQVTSEARERREGPPASVDLGFRYATFREYLARHRDEVVEVYKNVP